MTQPSKLSKVFHCIKWHIHRVIMAQALNILMLICLLTAIAVGLQWTENIAKNGSSVWSDVRICVGALLFFTALGLYAYLDTRKPKNSPPGPAWLPFVGSSRYLQRMRAKHGTQHQTFDAIAKEQGSPIFGLKLGGKHVIVLTSYELIHELLTREVFEGRPDNFFTRLRTMGTRRGISFVDGELWKEQRSFVVRTLRQLGLGKSSMEEKIVEELQEFTDMLRSTPRDKGVCLGQPLAMSVLNIMWVLIAGFRFSKEDVRMKRIIDFIKSRGKAFDIAGGMLAQFPWLRFVAPERSGYNLMVKINQEWTELITEAINEHKKNYSSNITKDLIDAFLHEMNAEKENNRSNYTVEQLIMVCLDLFVAGSGTTSNTLDFAFLMMIVNPDVQSQVQEELDRVIGRDRLPELSDQGSLPYTEAVLMESQRMFYVTPVSTTRRSLRDTTLQGYDIPKDTAFLTNLWSVLMDEAHWGDPHNFRPTRFLDERGDLIADNKLLPFSAGRRRCLGDALAKGCIFMFFTGVLQQFTVTHVEGCGLPSTIPRAGLTITPQPYNAVFLPRRQQ